jgi:Rod binding domain-containing protein
MTGVPPIANLPSQIWSMTSPLAGKGDFQGILRGLSGAQERGAARVAAAQLVASTFIMPVLAELREGSFLAGPFARGFAERQFQPLLDQQIADQVTGGASLPLVDVIVSRLLGPEAAPPEKGDADGR